MEILPSVLTDFWPWFGGRWWMGRLKFVCCSDEEQDIILTLYHRSDQLQMRQWRGTFNMGFARCWDAECGSGKYSGRPLQKEEVHTVDLELAVVFTTNCDMLQCSRLQCCTPTHPPTHPTTTHAPVKAACFTKCKDWWKLKAAESLEALERRVVWRTAAQTQRKPGSWVTLSEDINSQWKQLCRVQNTHGFHLFLFKKHFF